GGAAAPGFQHRGRTALQPEAPPAPCGSSGVLLVRWFAFRLMRLRETLSLSRVARGRPWKEWCVISRGSSVVLIRVGGRDSRTRSRRVALPPPWSECRGRRHHR